jgi:hypothetical protein
MARAIAIAVGILILAAVAHVTIQSTGGYGSAHAWVTIGVAAGVAAGSVFSGMAWSDGRHALAVLLVLAIAAGEAYGFIATAERLIVAREATQAPLRQLAEDRARTQGALDAATVALNGFPTSTPRLERALKDKAATDAAVVAKSADRGCVENCRRLLQAQADAAEQEVTRAREDMDRQKRDAQTRVATAKADLEALKPPASATPLADRLGWPAWMLDLLQSALGSIAANGLACFLMVFGAHRPKQQAKRTEVQEPTRSEIEVQAPREPKPSINAPGRTRAGKRKSTVRETDDPLLQAKAFAVARLAPAEDASANIKDVLRAYANWCRSDNVKQLPAEAMASALNTLFGVEKDGKDYMVLGVSLRAVENRAPKPIGALH